jgi:intracellular sulfur oxidation DsrE/DsrF family protein
MRIALVSLFSLALLLCSAVSSAAGPVTGPAVEGYGPVFPVAAGAFNLANDRHYKVSKDVSASSEDNSKLNRDFESAARFLNMQARNGTPMDQLDMAVIVHGMAAKDLLTDAAYQSRFGMNNPNTGLLSGLEQAGVAIYLCGQTASYRGFDEKELHSSVTMALSAMTAHVQLQTEGYTLIPF